jgi:hypothetical protein
LFLLSASALIALTAEGPRDEVVIVADSRRFSGWEAWWSNIYNESHLAFALLTIIVIPSLAFVLGSITEFFMARIGIDLKNRKLAEH